MKKVLIIVYYWPPSGGAGVQRWLKFAKYLPQFGWEPIIYTPENPDFQLRDDSLLKEIDPELQVIKRPIWEPYGFYRRIFSKKKDQAVSTGVKGGKGWTAKLANWIRGNVFVPDPKIYWKKPSVEFLRAYLKENPVDVIVSSGTPHSMHLIALELKRELGIPWVADFRDPWSQLDMLKEYHIHPSRMKVYRKMEKEVLEHADIALTTSKVWAADLEELGAKRAECITNGYDESDFDFQIQPYQWVVISHFGLLNHLRNPKLLWQCLEELLSEDPSLASELSLHLGGTIEPRVLEEINAYPHLSSCLKVFPYISHEEVIKEYAKSTLLLLLLFNSSSGKGNIPGKLFEYLASSKPILAFGPERGDSAEIVEESQGKYFLYSSNDKDSLKTWLREALQNKEGRQLNTKKYSRKSLTEQLARLLDQLV